MPLTAPLYRNEKYRTIGAFCIKRNTRLVRNARDISCPNPVIRPPAPQRAGAQDGAGSLCGYVGERDALPSYRARRDADSRGCSRQGRAGHRGLSSPAEAQSSGQALLAHQDQGVWEGKVLMTMAVRLVCERRIVFIFVVFYAHNLEKELFQTKRTCSIRFILILEISRFFIYIVELVFEQRDFLK